ncbi:MAG: sulfotransferase domain-containing protein [Candidatus Hydrogenedentota bacterium]
MLEKRLNKPTFIIAGAPRCGTGYLYHILDSNKEIYMSKPEKPEPKFFLVDEEYNKGFEYYLKKYFSNVKSETAIGEKSTNYMESTVVPERIKKHLPDVKLIFIFRNPIKRAFSNYLWSKKNGLEKLDFYEALLKEEEREKTLDQKYRYARPYSYISRGFYARYIKNYLKYFDKKNILFLLFEEFITERDVICKRIYKFLNVSYRIPDLEQNIKINQANDGTQEMSEHEYNYLKEIYKNENKELALIAGLDLTIWDTI